jgi:hypothetical protein
VRPTGPSSSRPRTPSRPRSFSRATLLRLILPAFALALAVGPAAAPATPTRLPKPVARHTPAPSCTVFEGLLGLLRLGSSSGPSVTKLPDHHTICSWKGQASGHYAFVLSIQVTAASSFLGRALLHVARTSAAAVERKTNGFGAYVSGNSRRHEFFEGAAIWGEEQRNKETRSCSGLKPGEAQEPGEKNSSAIEKGQGAPRCVGQPGTEGDFATAYGSPKPNGEAMLVQIGLACEENEVSPLTLLAYERLIYRGGR